MKNHILVLALTVIVSSLILVSGVSAQFNIQIDATALSAPQLDLSGVGTFSTQSVKSFVLVPGSYLLQYSSGAVPTPSFVLTVTNAGKVDFDPALDGVLTGRGSSTLVVNGRTVEVDARALTSPLIDLIAGISANFSTEAVLSFTLLPGVHLLRYASGVGPSPGFVLTVTNAGTVDFDPALDGVLSGRGSSTLVVLGAAIQIDATALDASSFNLAGIGTFSSDVVQIVVLLPGGHRYQTTGFDFVFSVTESATVDYDPFLDDILSGRGTNILVVLGTRPIAIAGPDQTVFEGDTVQLDGSGSFDPQGSPLTYQWQLLVPGSSAATLSDPMAVNPTFVADLPGDYLVQLIVNDGTEDSNPDEVTITAQTTEEATEDVVENVEELVEEGDLEGGQGNALTNKLQQAINKIPTQPQVAINLLNAFINQVSSLVEDGELSTEEGQALIDAAQAIIDEIEAQMRIVEAGPQEVLQALVEELPETYALHQNYPNPFNPETTIHYELPEAEQVTLRIFDTLGRVVAVLVDGPRAAGRYDVTFDASGLPSGVYLYQIRAGTFVESRRLVLLK